MKNKIKGGSSFLANAAFKAANMNPTLALGKKALSMAGVNPKNILSSAMSGASGASGVKNAISGAISSGMKNMMSSAMSPASQGSPTAKDNKNIQNPKSLSPEIQKNLYESLRALTASSEALAHAVAGEPPAGAQSGGALGTNPLGQIGKVGLNLMNNLKPSASPGAQAGAETPADPAAQPEAPAAQPEAPTNIKGGFKRTSKRLKSKKSRKSKKLRKLRKSRKFKRSSNRKR